MEILSLGEKIKRRRKELKMTLKDLAGDRITPGQISLVESGKSNPSMDLLEYLADSLGTSVEYLMETEESQAESICDFYENMSEAYLLDKDINKAEEYIEKSLYYAEKYLLESRKAKNLFIRGKISESKEELSLAQQCFLSANVIFIKYNKYEDVINTFLNLGVITSKLKAYHSSSNYFKQAEKVYIDNDIGNDKLLAEIYYHIAITFFRLGNTDKSMKYTFLAQEKFKQLNDRQNYAKALLMLSTQYSKNNDISNSIKYSRKALNVFEEINDSVYISEIENNLGQLFYEFDNNEESLIHLENAKNIRIKNRDNKLTDTLEKICNNHIKLKQIEKAKNILQEIQYEAEKGNNDALIKYYLLKYRIDLQQQNFDEAEETLIMGFELSKNIGKLKEASEIAITMGKYYINYSQNEKAAKYLNEAVKMLNELGIIKEY